MTGVDYDAKWNLPSAAARASALRLKRLPVMSRTRVKICGIHTARRRHCRGAGRADALGFNFWPGTSRMIAADAARAIADALPPYVTIVGLFVDPAPDHVRATLAALPLDLLQFHGSETADFCRAFGRPYIKAIAVGDKATRVDLLECAGTYPDARGLLFDAPPSGGVPGGTGHVFDWDMLPKDLPQPLVLSGGLNAANVGDAIRRDAARGGRCLGGVEVAEGADPGLKDHRAVAFIEGFAMQMAISPITCPRAWAFRSPAESSSPD
jgi:phosphoribosylanthranilate isomerase